MANKPKSSILIIILVVLALSAGAFYLLQKERAKSLFLKTQLEEVMIKYRKSESELEGTKRRVFELESQLKEAQGKIDSVANELQQATAVKQEALSKLEQLTAELGEQKTIKSNLEKKIILAQEDREKILARLNEIVTQKKELETKIKDLEAKIPAEQTQGVELGTIVVAPEIPLSGLEGNILVVNKDYDFVVTNLGSKDGINAGNILSVYHKNKYLGDIKVERVHDSMSAAGFVSSDIKDKVSEGDRVILKTK